MPSLQANEPRWSLTRRLSQRFAIVAASVLLLYALLNGYFLLAELREDFKDFMEHELAEVEFSIRSRDLTPENIVAAVRNATSASSEPSYAIRVRGGDGALITQGGDAKLLALVPESLPEDPNWRQYLISRGVTIASEDIDGSSSTLEMIVDSERLTNEMSQYITYALISFCVAVTIAALAGWLTARHSLRSLNEVVARAEQFRSPDEAQPIRLEDAPREIFNVGNALNRMIERVHDALYRLRTFTAGLAHELRSPLQNLIGETEVTLLADRTPEQYRQLLKSHLEDMTELSDAVDNLITWCRSHEPRSGESEVFDLAAEAELRLQRERRSAERLGLTLQFKSVGDAHLRADREGCLRVLRNLVGNALFWTKPGSNVAVAIDGLADRVRITVDDEGPGVDPAVADRIFEPFVSGAAKSGKRGSYGLGLAICRQVVDEHGGVLRWEPRSGGGARFVAEFSKTPRVG